MKVCSQLEAEILNTMDTLARQPSKSSSFSVIEKSLFDFLPFINIIINCAKLKMNELISFLIIIKLLWILEI